MSGEVRYEIHGSVTVNEESYVRIELRVGSLNAATFTGHCKGLHEINQIFEQACKSLASTIEREMYERLKAVMAREDRIKGVVGEIVKP